MFTDQGAEKHEGTGQPSGITDQEKELSASAAQAFIVRNGLTFKSAHIRTAKYGFVHMNF